MKTSASVFLIAFLFLFAGCSEKQDTNREKLQNSKLENQSAPNYLPEIGKWMVDSTGKPSSWLGKKLDGKTIREPINIIIIDSVSKSVDEAKQNLISAFDKAGYKDRWGHSSGYKGLIAGIYFNQIPDEYFHAFSTRPFEFDNNHGRIFGPCPAGGIYYFAGALSRESGYSHNYISFTRARDDLAASLNSNTAYKIIGKVELNNSIVSDSLTTGDHDGNAVLISVSR